MQLHTSSLGAFLVLGGVVCVLHTEPEGRVNVAVPNCAQNRTVLNTTGQSWEEPQENGAEETARKEKRRSVCHTAPQVTFKTVGVIGADARDRTYRDRDHPNRG